MVEEGEGRGQSMVKGEEIGMATTKERVDTEFSREIIRVIFREIILGIRTLTPDRGTKVIPTRGVMVRVVKHRSKILTVKERGKGKARERVSARPATQTLTPA